jgi:hypothetical protein
LVASTKTKAAFFEPFCIIKLGHMTRYVTHKNSGFNHFLISLAQNSMTM